MKFIILLTLSFYGFLQPLNATWMGDKDYDERPSIRVDRTRPLYHKFFEALENENVASAKYYADVNEFIVIYGLIGDFLKLKLNIPEENFEKWMHQKGSEALEQIKKKMPSGKYEINLWVDIDFVKDQDTLPPLKAYPHMQKWWAHIFSPVGNFTREPMPFPELTMTMDLPQCHFKFTNKETREVFSCEKLF